MGHQYLVDTGTYCINYEATFTFLKEAYPPMTIEQMEDFLWKDGKLEEMSDEIKNLSKTGLRICAAFRELKNNLKNDSFYKCSKWTNWLMILGGAAGLILGVTGIICPALWLVDSMHTTTSNLSHSANAHNRKVQVFKVAFGQRHINRKIITEMCDSFEELRRSVGTALGGKSNYRCSEMIAFATGAGVGGAAAVAMSSQTR